MGDAVDVGGQTIGAASWMSEPGAEGVVAKCKRVFICRR